MGSAACTKCKLTKPLSGFYLDRGRRRSECKTCLLARKNVSYHSRQSAQLAARKCNLMRMYGITIEQYDEMYDAQHGACGICERHSTEFPQRLAVDHCHTTGRIRGLLCSYCNRALGAFRDDPAALQRAARYVCT